MDEVPRVIVLVEAVAGQVSPFVDNDNPPTQYRGRSLRDDTSGRSCADDQQITDFHERLTRVAGSVSA
ncbi:MAG: hypothetical protein M5U09_27380 [Gammaproteobacteria bacterium]|nr:hypothetical protein [Gammaproteobacteria bacterium]